jgi:hypothetical protein
MLVEQLTDFIHNKNSRRFKDGHGWMALEEQCRPTAKYAGQFKWYLPQAMIFFG